MKQKVYQLNDRSMKYCSMAQSKRQYQYLGLPGKFKNRVPQEIVFPNMDSGRMDECIIADKDLVVILEEESDDVGLNTLEKFAKYIIFVCFMYFPRKPYLAVICHKDPKKEQECWEYAPSMYIDVHYYHFSQEELWKKYENLINKVKQKIQLTDMEALDMAFVCKFISKKHAPEIIESVVKMFKDAIIADELLKIDVGAIIIGMISKRIDDVGKQNRLLEMMNVRYYEDEFQKLVYDEFGDVLDRKDEQIRSQAEEIKSKDYEIKSKDYEIKSKDYELKSKDDELKSQAEKIDDFNNAYEEMKKKFANFLESDDSIPSETKKILSSMIII